MDRRSFIRSAGVLGAGAATGALAAPAIAQGMRELKMVTSWPKNFPGLGTAPERFAVRVGAMTEGKIKVTVYGAGELVPPLKCNDAVQEGAADLYHSADYYYQGKSPAYPFFTAVPMGFRPDEINAWIHHAGGQALWDEVGAQFGIKHFPCGNSGSQMGGWFREEITSTEDFKGLKMRIPGIAGNVIEALGGTSVTLAGGEILPALQSGAIDATEWVGPWNDLAFGFYKITKHYYYPGFHEPGSMLSLGISLNLWESLSDSEKQIFESAALAENNVTLAEFDANNSQALTTLIDTHGVQLHEFPDDVFAAFGEASRDIVASVGQGDDLSRRVYESYSAFRKNAIGWSKLSDQAYMNKRSLVEG